MAAPYSAYTRPHWGGPNEDVDIHLEVFDGEIDASFQMDSWFRQGHAFKTVKDRSNTVRIDRMSNIEVSGRKSMEPVERSSFKSDKLLITVDTVIYISNPIDWADDWTAPDFIPAQGREHGIAHAKFFDQAHIIQLQKARKWVAPAHLRGSHYDGIEVEAAYDADEEIFADNIAKAHKKIVEAMVMRDLDTLDEFITLMDPAIFSVVVEHKKLMNELYSPANGDYAKRRCAYLNGMRIVELPRFPQAPITNHKLGADFNVDADDVACKVIVYHPRMTLLTVEAKEMQTDFYPDKLNQCNMLDSYTMYQIGQRRADTSGAIKITGQP